MAKLTAIPTAHYTPIDRGFLEDSDEDGDIEMTTNETDAVSLHDVSVSLSGGDRLIVAIDFGTTFSSVAYACVKNGMQPGELNIDNVRCIENYPDYRAPAGAQEPRYDVPTELWYDTSAESTQMIYSTSSQRIAPESNSSDGYESSNDDLSSSEDDFGGAQNRDYERNSPVDSIGGSKPQHWGFGVQKRLKMMDIPRHEARRLSRFKLMLDRNEATISVRTGLAPIIQNLIKRKIIKKDMDIFAHFLTQLLHHTKSELQKSRQLVDGMPIEFVVCVPAKWPSKGCRVMQTAMKIAVEESGLGNGTSNSACNLFIISEPEAAAACVLAENENELFYEECVVVIDAGGGTIDAVTYQCTKETPLRLNAEIVEPDSQLHGASYINERFEELLLEKLKNEHYLEKNGKTIKSIAEALTIAFENGEKRTINTTRRHAVIDPLWIDDLEPTPENGLYQNRLHITHEEIKNVFQRSLREAKKILTRQLEMAKDKGYSVQKVILTGGFGQSPALQEYLERYVTRETNARGGRIGFMIPQSPSTAVAKGAVLRALNKEDGPKRITQCSYGFLLTEPYEPDVYAAHKNTRCKIDKADGERYIDSTIAWLINKGETLPNRKEESIPMKHTFKLNVTSLKCEEEVYVSDQKHDSHYRKKHANNKAAELAGYIVADMTFLRTEGLIQPEEPSELSKHYRTQKRYWAVNFDLVMIVEGRNLSYEARWPPKSELKESEEQTTKAQGQICIAAAFQPGTA